MSATTTLRAGDDVDRLFAVTRKDRLTARTGLPYLALELRDPSGTIAARAFRGADMLAGRFERGDLVRVRGTVGRYREALQVEVDDIVRANAGEADPGDFLPTAYRDLDELDGFLESLAGEVRQPGYAGLLAALLDDAELRAAWRRAPCSRAGHHAYLGGLLEHTVAVAQLAHELCQIHLRLDHDLLLSAAIVHDLGKTREFTYGADIELSDDGRLLGHIVLGQRIIEAHRPASLDEPRLLALLHCVITHHGPEGVPGRRFGLAEALALQRLNALDAGVKGAFEHGLGAS